MQLADLFVFLDQDGMAPKDKPAPEATPEHYKAKFKHLTPNQVKLLKLLFDGRDRRKVLVQKLNELAEEGIIAADATFVTIIQVYILDQ